MIMEYTIIDDFLPQELFESLQFIMMDSSTLDWYYNPYVGHSGEDGKHFQFTHNAYNDYSPKSNLYHALVPVIDKIAPKALIRIKANMGTRTAEIEEQAWHTDFDFPCRTAILYMNDNNGHTIFEDGTIVESKANRFVEFDSQLKHTGTSHTDVNVRVVINFNYFK